MISIISVFNNKDILEETLLKSLEKQKTKYELILIDNTLNKYTSASKALNEGIISAKGNVVVTVHQDVEFKKFQLDLLIKYMNDLGGNSIIGVAGRKDSSGTLTNVKHGNDCKYAGKYRVYEPMEVQTLDEVCIVAEKKTFLKTPFDDLTCDNWHLYGADFCLSNKKNGIISYVVPIDLIHKSEGNVNNSYYDSLFQVSKKHKNEFTNIYTSCAVINTNAVLSITFVFLSKFKNYLRGFINT